MHRRAMIVFGLWVMSATAESALAQTPVHPAAPPGAIQIGVTAAVRGRVELTRPGAVGKVVQSGEAVFLGDVIQTDAKGTLQILLLDETVFTIGPNSAITIDEFVFDPTTNAGKVSASVVKGVFRFVTGKVAQREPKAMQVKLPAGLIGIRGTIVAGKVEGQQALVVLLGPGPKNNTGERPGQITVGNLVGGQLQEVLITRPGYGTEIAGLDVPPTPPAPVPPAELAAITQALEPDAPTASAPADQAAEATVSSPDSAAQLAGQALIEALQSLFGVSTLTELIQLAADEVNQAAQDSADETTKVADGISTKDQLRTIETGQFHFKFGTIASPKVFTQTTKNGDPVSIAGVIHAFVNLDFGARTVGGGNSHVKGGTASTVAGCSGCTGDISFNETIEAQSFSSGSGNATFTDTGGGLTGTITLNNSGGTVAGTVTGEATFDNGLSGTSRDAGSASAATVSRESGLSPADGD